MSDLEEEPSKINLDLLKISKVLGENPEDYKSQSCQAAKIGKALSARKGEIRQQIKKETIGKDNDKVKKVTMITSDVINATAAIAENIDTIFISKIDYEKTSTRSCNLFQVTILIIMSAILFEEIEVAI